MPFPDEQPLTHNELASIDETAVDTLSSVQQYITQVRDVAVAPMTFLEAPTANLSRASSEPNGYLCSALRPPSTEYFIERMDEMIACRDQLLEVEKQAPSSESLPRLIELGVELSEHGCPRLEIRREFVEMLIADDGMTSKEISALIGEQGITSDHYR